MINTFNAKSIYIGTDLKRFNEIRDYLDQNKIKYKYKVKNRMGEWNGRGTVRGTVGSAGNDAAMMDEYEILVHKRDADRVSV